MRGWVSRIAEHPEKRYGWAGSGGWEGGGKGFVRVRRASSLSFMISRLRPDWILLILVLTGISTIIISTPANTDAPT